MIGLPSHTERLMTGEGGGVKYEPNHATVLVVYKSWDGAWSSINHSILLGWQYQSHILIKIKSFQRIFPPVDFLQSWINKLFKHFGAFSRKNDGRKVVLGRNAWLSKKWQSSIYSLSHTEVYTAHVYTITLNLPCLKADAWVWGGGGLGQMWPIIPVGIHTHTYTQSASCVRLHSVYRGPARTLVSHYDSHQFWVRSN